MITQSILTVGDTIEVRIRARLANIEESGDGEDWISAVVRDAEPCTWPMAHLANGTITEIRPFMESRYAAPSA